MRRKSKAPIPFDRVRTRAKRGAAIAGGWSPPRAPRRRKRASAKRPGGLVMAFVCLAAIAAAAWLTGRDIRDVADDVFAPPATPVVASLRAVDGDTLRRADGETIRISNIDTAEMPPRAKCDYEQELALAAKARLGALVESASEVAFVPDRRERDKFGRLLGRVEVDGRDVGEQLIAEGLARPWEGRRKAWCEAALQRS